MGMFDSLIGGIGGIIGARREAKGAKKAYEALQQAYENMPGVPQYQQPKYQTDVQTTLAGVERVGFADPGSAEAAKQAAYQSAYGKLDRALNAVPGLRGGVATGLGSRAVADVFTPLAADIENMARQHGMQRAQMQQQVGMFNAGQANSAQQQFADARNRALLALTQQRNALSSTDAARQYQAGLEQRLAAERQAQALYGAQTGKSTASANAARSFGAGLSGIANTLGQAALMGMGGAGLAAGGAASPWQSAASVMMGWGDPRG